MAFGVGAGGSGIGDYFSDLFNRNSVASGQPSVEDAQKKVAENPNDPKARLELANALQAAKRPEDAIKELERYVALRPKDADALQQLGALYDQRALSARRDLAAAQAGAPGSAFGQDLANPSSRSRRLLAKARSTTSSSSGRVKSRTPRSPRSRRPTPRKPTSTSS